MKMFVVMYDTGVGKVQIVPLEEVVSVEGDPNTGTCELWTRSKFTYTIPFNVADAFTLLWVEGRLNRTNNPKIGYINASLLSEEMVMKNLGDFQ